MSLNRENVIWQSEDGTWNRGFFAFYYTRQDADDFDPEWDVEYEQEFNWVRVGLPTREAAEGCWTGANPGGHMVIERSPGTVEERAAYDELARACIQEQVS